ncbi:MAG: ABC transporter ATP-binding protein [Lachnospiraceae bacterium]|nr:ABC transporter ATP-binding protein [Lachnospiraceae bacterium]
MDISLEHISKAFGEQRVLRGVNLTFEEGRTTCLMGPSGNGKTTLLRILTGLEKADEGKVLGVPEKIAMVFQEDRLLLERTALENVCIAAGVTEREAEEAFRAVGLSEYEEKPAEQLSGGMARRVAIVRACLADAELIVMDEPFKGLDEGTLDLVITFIKARLENKTVIIVTHLPEEAEKIGGKIVWLDQVSEPSLP